MGPYLALGVVLAYLVFGLLLGLAMVLVLHEVDRGDRDVPVANKRAVGDFLDDLYAQSERPAAYLVLMVMLTWPRVLLVLRGR